jgi:suppressor of fused
MSEDTNSSGWRAIDTVFERLYPQQEPLHWGTLISWRLGGNDPLDGISAYRASEPVPHWHFVTFGLSELHEKESKNKDWSGWGFEFTFRLARTKTENAPPMWALGFLQNLARYVCQTGNIFEINHHIDLNGPIELGSHTKICAALFLRDPQTESLDTPNGKLDFLQIVGITRDELDAVNHWSTVEMLKLLVKKHPQYITDVDRDSILDDPSIAKKVTAGITRDGSSVRDIAVAEGATWKQNKRKKPPQTEITISTQLVARMLHLLPGRILFEREFQFSGSPQILQFVPGKQSGCQTAGDVLRVTLTQAVAQQMIDTLTRNPGPTTHEWPSFPGFKINVRETQIVDSNGNPVPKKN